MNSNYGESPVTKILPLIKELEFLEEQKSNIWNRYFRLEMKKLLNGVSYQNKGGNAWMNISV